MNPTILLIFALGFSVAWILIGLILKHPRLSDLIVRGRDFHHGHRGAVPRLGGLGLAAAFTACALAIAFSGAISPGGTATLAIIVLGALAMFAVGFWDDLRPLGARAKLAAQVAIAAAVYSGGVRIELVKSPFTDADVPLGIWSLVLTTLWLVALTNLINLIDGIDGLAGGICLMLMFLLANVGMGTDTGLSMLLAIGMSGALIAFLRYNYPPAKIYMGDGGAYFLGFLIGVLSIVNSNKGTVAAALIAPAFALALPVVDVSLAILRRAVRGLPIFRPDRKHIHHHMITLGLSHEGTLLNLYTVSLMCLFLAFGIFYWQGRMLPLYTGMLFLVLVIAGHLSGFTRNWFEISSQLGRSLALRKETRYALTLSRWFLLEIERHDSAAEFWRDYQFLVRKLHLASVKVTLPDGSSNIWQDEELDHLVGNFHRAIHEISDGTILEFHSEKEAGPNILFNLLGDLAAETWYKAASRWKATDKPPLHFAFGAGSQAHNRELKDLEFAMQPEQS